MTRSATNELATRVARHFSEPEWFTTFEFPLYGAVETTDGKDRSIDALAVSRISGRGNEVVGIEIKSDRADWLKELNTPAKAEAWTQLLDRFWLVAGKDVARPEEVPSTWGFLEENGSGLRVVRRAPPLEATKRLRDSGGDPIPREVWVRILRRTLDGSGIGPQVRAAFGRGHTAGVKEVEDRLRSDTRDRDDRYDRLVETVRAFQKASGLEFIEFRNDREGHEVAGWAIGEWAGERLGQAVKVVIEHKDFIRMAGQDLLNYERITRDLRKALEAAGWTPPKEDEPL